jgi:hypothetical protein
VKKELEEGKGREGGDFHWLLFGFGISNTATGQSVIHKIAKP